MMIQVKVVPNSSEDRVVGLDENGVLKVKCRADLEDGTTNDAVVAILAQHFKVSERNIRIMKGAFGPLKIVLIEGKVDK